jgi:hypothetical protein
MTWTVRLGYTFASRSPFAQARELAAAQMARGATASCLDGDSKEMRLPKMVPLSFDHGRLELAVLSRRLYNGPKPEQINDISPKEADATLKFAHECCDTWYDKAAAFIATKVPVDCYYAIEKTLLRSGIWSFELRYMRKK